MCVCVCVCVSVEITQYACQKIARIWIIDNKLEWIIVDS